MAGHRRAEATPSFGRLCPAMTELGRLAAAVPRPRNPRPHHILHKYRTIVSFDFTWVHSIAEECEKSRINRLFAHTIVAFNFKACTFGALTQCLPMRWANAHQAYSRLHCKSRTSDHHR
jgi:hypothetical protein